MPELPEVETTVNGISQAMLGQKIKQVIIRQPKLRWDIPKQLTRSVQNQVIQSITRRGKYILINCQTGTMILHLGMSGRLRIISAGIPPEKHDHVDIVVGNGQCCRFTDPRRFGCLLWTADDPLQHKLLEKLGPEPLSRQFTTKFLFERSRNRKVPIKSFIMDSHVVVGVGNIYATEALFFCNIHPNKPAGEINLELAKLLVSEIKRILKHAIKQGGTTLKDFRKTDGKPGYFKQELAVYGRAGEDCINCATPLVSMQIGQRTTVYCPQCQC